MNKRGAIAFSQILILVIGIVTISYAVGSEVRVVGGEIVEETLPGVATETKIKTIKDSTGGEFDIMDYLFGTGEGLVGVDYALQSVVSSAAWGLAAYYIVKTLGGMLGLDEAQVNAASKAAGWGAAVGKGVYAIANTEGAWSKGVHYLTDWALPKTWETSFGVGMTWGIVVAAVMYYYSYRDTSTETVTYTCDVWDAPTGGKNCEQCNEMGEGIPCSEYQCRSLGQACQLLNPGTGEESCEWVNKNDVSFPVIEPWKDALLDDYKYTPDKTISPPDRGVIVFNELSTTGCVKAFTPLTFGVILDEPGKCKLDYLRKQSFDEMQYDFGGSSLFRYNHTQVMSLPGKANLEAENMTLQNDGNYEIYTRCQDANGNTNTANFVFKFCVEQGPDTTPPLIVTTNLINGMPIAYNQSSVDLEVYINEPADCKWSYKDQSYEDMETQMKCSSSIMEMNAQMLYKCSTTLTGLKNRQENKFYFRCQDKPLTSEDRNTNAESYEFLLIGTQPLVIDSLEPNGTIKDSTEVVKVSLEVETSAGYNEGEAICYYSDTQDEQDYIMFFETNSYKHTQDLHLLAGDYEYFIKCLDLGGNQDTNSIKFRVESDSTAPLVVRAFHEETYLKLITNEPAECVYDIVDCSYLFNDGTSLTAVDDADHYTDWKTDTNFYVKCQDEYGNQPLPNECNIIVKPFEVYGEEE
ncbi:MAG: hypothetical protein KKG94_04020 [Nanoarchaeota archaeon]|nr:hypothetical protein [Nanoarchaeota archaeon]